MSSVEGASLEARLRAEDFEPSVWSSLPGDRFEHQAAGTAGTSARGRGYRW